MIMEFIAACVAGVAMAGIAMGLRWVSRGYLPKWIVPVFAGAGMLAFAIWQDYSWFERVKQSATPGIEVVYHNEDVSILRPWTFYKPVVTQFTAIDKESIRRNPNLPDQLMIDLAFVVRYQRSIRLTYVFDCAGKRRGDFGGREVTVAEDGSFENLDWAQLAEGDPVLAAVCAAR